MREGLKKKVDDYKRALDKRHEYASGAAEKSKTMRGRLAAIDGEIADAEKEVEQAAGGWLAVVGVGRSLMTVWSPY